MIELDEKEKYYDEYHDQLIDHLLNKGGSHEDKLAYAKTIVQMIDFRNTQKQSKIDDIIENASRKENEM